MIIDRTVLPQPHVITVHANQPEANLVTFSQLTQVGPTKQQHKQPNTTYHATMLTCLHAA